MLNIPEYLYHATYKPLLKNIILLGLGKTNRKNWEDSKSNVINLSDDPYVAESYAETSEMIPEEWIGQIIILKINTANLDKNKLFIDENNLDGDTFEYHGIISPEHLSFV